MKKLYALAFACTSVAAYAQSDLQYWRPDDQRGVNTFETSKVDTVGYDGFKVRVGGDFALQFQGINQWNDNANTVELENNFNLPTANLNLDAQLYDGVRMNLMVYLSSRHHNEAWVKGGYIQMDKLDFIKKDFMKGIMDYTTIKIGMDEINYGDAHFRRTDNAKAIYNPFVGNYIMDSFTTEAFAEAAVQSNGWLGVVGVSNGKLNQTTSNPNGNDYGVSIYGKLGIDKQINEDLRTRLTGSVYHNGSYANGGYMYGGDRAGGRYYNVASYVAPDGSIVSSDFSGRVNPGFKKVTNLQVNPFVKYKGFEFFGIYEVSMGDKSEDVTGGMYTQYAAELLYRFGQDERYYVGGRYNLVNGTDYDGAAEKSVARYNIGAGWFMTKNILTKLEYVNQQYSGAGYEGSDYQGMKFNGVVFEAVIGL